MRSASYGVEGYFGLSDIGKLLVHGTARGFRLVEEGETRFVILLTRRRHEPLGGIDGY
jgi:hypothetical protein